MLKKTVTYEDYDGNTRTEDLYFNLTRAEALDIAFELPDGLTDSLSDRITSDDPDKTEQRQVALTLLDKLGSAGIYKFIKSIVTKSYGVKSADGKRFEKSEELTTKFTQTLAYDAVLMEFISDDVAAAEFINSVLPVKAINKLTSK